MNQFAQEYYYNDYGDFIFLDLTANINHVIQYIPAAFSIEKKVLKAKTLTRDQYFRPTDELPDSKIKHHTLTE